MSVRCRVGQCVHPVEDYSEMLCWRHAHRLRVVGSAVSDEPTPHSVYTPEVVSRLIRTAIRPMMPVPSDLPLVEDKEQTTVESLRSEPNTEPRVRVNLERGQRGGYGWSVTIRGEDREAVLDELRQIDGILRDTYAPVAVTEDAASVTSGQVV